MKTMAQSLVGCACDVPGKFQGRVLNGDDLLCFLLHYSWGQKVGSLQVLRCRVIHQVAAREISTGRTASMNHGDYAGITPTSALPTQRSIRSMKFRGSLRGVTGGNPGTRGTAPAIWVLRTQAKNLPGPNRTPSSDLLLSNTCPFRVLTAGLIFRASTISSFTQKHTESAIGCEPTTSRCYSFRPRYTQVHATLVSFGSLPFHISSWWSPINLSNYLPASTSPCSVVREKVGRHLTPVRPISEGKRITASDPVSNLGRL